jgi:hypothetical protein
MKKNNLLIAILIINCFVTIPINLLAQNNKYIQRFLDLRAKLVNPATGYFSPEGAPYHSIETLMVEAPDHGHESTSEAYSFWIWLEAMYGRIQGDWGPLNNAWATLERHTIPADSLQPTNSAYVTGGAKATYASEYPLPSMYPSALDGSVPVGTEPVSKELYNTYGTPNVYGMHWLFDCDNFYGYGIKGSPNAKPSYINTFQRGEQESTWETVPQPCYDLFTSGGKNGFLDLFVKESGTPSKQWKYTNAPDADARAVQALYWATEWAKAQGKTASDVPASLASKMGDYLRLAMFDKYYKPIGCQSKSAAGASGYGSAHYLMSWYYAWGGPHDPSQSWAWRIGCSHSHFGYQNPVAAYALSNYSDLIPRSPNAKNDWATSLQRQLEFYRWLQSAEGAIAGGCTNMWDGNYSAYPSNRATFYGMAYVENPVYADPGSNTWFGFQAWSVERLAEYYYLTNNALAKQVLDKWVTWVKSVVILNSDGTFAIPSEISWSGQPDTWNAANPGANAGLHVNVVSYGTDLGITACTAKALTYYAAATKKYGTLDDAARKLAQELLDRMYNNYWEGANGKGYGVVEVRKDFRRFDSLVYIPAGWSGKMPNGDIIQPGIKFIDIRTKYKSDPLYTSLRNALDNGKDFSITYHRFWAQADIALANAEYGYLFPTTGPTYTITANAGIGGTITPSGAVSVDSGSNSTFTITPNTGYKISSVTVDGTSVGAVASYTFTNITTNHTISASFVTAPTYTITATAGTGGTISPSGSVAVNEGANRTFTITPNSGYKISSVTVDGTSVGAVTSYTFTNVVANHTIAASFVAVPTYTISASAGTGGTISPSGNVTVNEGANQTFSVTPNAGYTISSVTVDGASVGAVASYTFTNVLANHTIAATFEESSCDLLSLFGAPTANPLPSINTNYSYVHILGNHAAITNITRFTINWDLANRGLYEFSINTNNGVPNWYVDLRSSLTFSFNTASPSATITGSGAGLDGDYYVANDNGNFVMIDKSAAYAIYFSKSATPPQGCGNVTNYTISASAGTGGTITPSGAVTVAKGGSKSFAIAAGAGYKISGVTVDGTSVGAVSTYTFTNVQADHTIAASFVATPTFTISASAGTGGSITPSGAVSVAQGANQAFAIAAASGYKINDVTVDGSSVGAVASYSFSNVQANHTIAASFAPDNNPCDLLAKYAVPRTSPLPTLNNNSYSHSYTLGTGGPTLSNVTVFTINWDLPNKGLYQFSMNTNNGVPSWWIDLLPKISQTFASSSPAGTLSGTGISGLDGEYWANVDGSNFVLVAKSGAYALYFTNGSAPAGCPVKSAEEITGIKLQNAEVVTLFPNPADRNASISINLKSQVNGASYCITDMNGKTVVSGKLMSNMNSIALPANVKSGLYLVKISSGNRQLIQKLVIK